MLSLPPRRNWITSQFKYYHRLACNSYIKTMIVPVVTIMTRWMIVTSMMLIMTNRVNPKYQLNCEAVSCDIFCFICNDPLWQVCGWGGEYWFFCENFGELLKLYLITRSQPRSRKLKVSQKDSSAGEQWTQHPAKQCNRNPAKQCNRKSEGLKLHW